MTREHRETAPNERDGSIRFPGDDPTGDASSQAHQALVLFAFRPQIGFAVVVDFDMHKARPAANGAIVDERLSGPSAGIDRQRVLLAAVVTNEAGDFLHDDLAEPPWLGGACAPAVSWQECFGRGEKNIRTFPRQGTCGEAMDRARAGGLPAMGYCFMLAAETVTTPKSFSTSGCTVNSRRPRSQVVALPSTSTSVT